MADDALARAREVATEALLGGSCICGYRSMAGVVVDALRDAGLLAVAGGFEGQRYWGRLDGEVLRMCGEEFPPSCDDGCVEFERDIWAGPWRPVESES